MKVRKITWQDSWILPTTPRIKNTERKKADVTVDHKGHDPVMRDFTCSKLAHTASKLFHTLSFQKSIYLYKQAYQIGKSSSVKIVWMPIDCLKLHCIVKIQKKYIINEYQQSVIYKIHNWARPDLILLSRNPMSEKYWWHWRTQWGERGAAGL